jgi:cysteinyl-tRNA synthetase
MIEKRNIAKKNRDFVMADLIREELKQKGILIKDTREGTTFEIIS